MLSQACAHLHAFTCACTYAFTSPLHYNLHSVRRVLNQFLVIYILGLHNGTVLLNCVLQYIGLLFRWDKLIPSLIIFVLDKIIVLKQNGAT